MFSRKKIKSLEEQLLVMQTELHTTKEQLLQKVDQLSEITTELNTTRELLETCTKEKSKLIDKYQHVIDIENEVGRKQEELANTQQAIDDLNKKYQEALLMHENLVLENSLYEDQLEIGSFGLYKPQFNFDTSEQFKAAMETNYEQQRKMIKDEKAITCHTEWTVSGSKTEGKKMTTQYKKLMMFAFNGECEGLIARVKWNNAEKSKDRIVKAFQAVNKLGVTHNIEIMTDYVGLKLTELSLTYEYDLKKYEEKEEQRRIREQMREEEKAQREFERAQREAEDEEYQYAKALEKVKAELQLKDQENNEMLLERVKLLEKQLQEAHEKKERAVALAQLTRVGHIYVISNIGSFGEDVYKMGMTRRLDPLDRVRELSDASVPFHFDVHAIIYSENAPQLEYELHRKFNDRRMNRINSKKEFFRVSLSEIESFVNEHTGASIEFTKVAEAKDYRETLTLLERLKVEIKSDLQPNKLPANIG